MLECPTLDRLSHSDTDVGYLVSVQTQETVFFRDGVRKIDFVLAYDSSRDKTNTENIRTTFEDNLMKEGMRWNTFHSIYACELTRNLSITIFYHYKVEYAQSCLRDANKLLGLVEGLELELESPKYSYNGKITFLKIHAPWNVLSSCAEMTSLQMPMIENDIELGLWLSIVDIFIAIDNNIYN